MVIALLVGSGSAPRATETDQVRPARKASTPLELARRRVLTTRPLRMFYSTDEDPAVEALETHRAEITLIAPQCYAVDEEGFVRGALPPRLAQSARRAHVAVMPLLFNPGFKRTTVTALLRSPRAQQRAIAYMAYLARRDDALGFQIDFENLEPSDRTRFTQFVRRAALRLHRDGRLLSVAVPPRFSDRTGPARRRDEFPTTDWAAPFDYRGLGLVADFLTVMTYDHASRMGPPGPVAGYAWVKKALDYAVGRVPRGKLLLGLPLYGRDWGQSDGETTSRTLTLHDVGALLARPGVTQHRDERWRSPWFQYREGETLRTVWFEDVLSLREKLTLMRQYRLRGFAAWRLGAENDGFWDLLSSLERPKRAPLLRRAAKSPTISRR